MMTLPFAEAIVAAGLLIGLLLAVEAGYRLGLREATAEKRSGGNEAGIQTGAVQGATLGLLGLLLGFSFAGAAGRYIERQDLIASEANAISTGYLRAELLPQPHSEDLQQALREYLAHRLEASTNLRHGLSLETAAQIERYHDRIWQAAAAGVGEAPEFAEPVLDTVNEVLDLHASRIAAGEKHLPGLVLGLLVLCAGLAVGSIGYGCGLAQRRSLLMTAPLAMVVSAALWTTIDLDYPRLGLVRVSDRPLAGVRLP